LADAATDTGAAALVRATPSVDILVNNLGIYEIKDFAAITDADWRRYFEVNVLSGARLARSYFPGMLERNWGRIIFISSESGLMTPGEMIHYGMTKTAQLAVSRGLAGLTKGTRVTVNSVLPGPTRSEGIIDFLKSLASDPSAGVGPSGWTASSCRFDRLLGVLVLKLYGLRYPSAGWSRRAL